MRSDFERERKEPDISAKKEAISILHAMKRGCVRDKEPGHSNCFDMSDVFNTPPRVAALLLEFSKGDSVDALNVRNALDFRAKVRSYLDRLLAGEDIALEGADAEEAEEIEADIADIEAANSASEGPIAIDSNSLGLPESFL